MNIVKELNILFEEFKFQPRKLSNREEKKEEMDLKKLEEYKKILSNKTHIGDLLIISNTLEDLVNLKQVEGVLEIVDCHRLTTLSNLNYVSRDLLLLGCENLKSLGNLRFVGGRLEILDCDAIDISQLKKIDCKNRVSINNKEFKNMEEFIKFGSTKF